MLTRKQLECYRAMEAYYKRNGVMPSYEELADLVGYKSKSGVHRLVEALETRGVLFKLKGCARATRLLPLNQATEKGQQ